MVPQLTTDPKVFETLDRKETEITTNPPVHHQRIVEDLNALPGVKVVSTYASDGNYSAPKEEFHLAVTEEGISPLQAVFHRWSEYVADQRPRHTAGSECTLGYRYFDFYLNRERTTFRGMVLSILPRGDRKIEELHRKALETALYNCNTAIWVRQSPDHDWTVINEINDFTHGFYNLPFIRELLKDESHTGFFLQGLPHGRYNLQSAKKEDNRSIITTVGEMQTFSRHSRWWLGLTFHDAAIEPPDTIDVIR